MLWKADSFAADPSSTGPAAKDRHVHDGNAMARNFIPHDDKGREQWPLAAVLVCQNCGHRQTIRTVGHAQLKRTAARARWSWRGWIVGRQAQSMTCWACMVKQHEGRSE